MSSAELHTALSLSEWESFYVILGTSGAALTGLTFIMITLASDKNPVEGDSNPRARLSGVRAFITPTAVYFGAALWFSALLCVPGQTPFSLAICLGFSGIAGLGYCVRVTRSLLDATAQYKPFLSDWIWNVVLPTAAFVTTLGVAALMTSHPEPALYLIAGLTLALLFIGIHNAWDVVVWMTTERHAYKDRAATPPANSADAAPIAGAQIEPAAIEQSRS